MTCNLSKKIRFISATLLPKFLSGELSVDALKITNEQGM
jgi:hypothetical protein